MAKCNLLQPTLNSDSGTFYTFSQWTDDMTLQNALGDAYRIVPSRFACFNVSNTNDIGIKLQNYFEHYCAAFRHYMDVNSEHGKFNPKHASILFWKALKDQGIVTSDYSNMVFVGEMDLQGTNYIDGVSYSELYCIVPSNAKKMKNWIISPSPSQTEVLNFDTSGYGDPFGWYTLPSGVTGGAPTNLTLPLYFDGPMMFTTEDNQTIYSSMNTLDSLHQVYMKDVFNGVRCSFDTEATEFNFNVLALFYDVVAKDEHNDYHYIYTAVPMGLYVSQGSEPIKKYVKNDDIYGQGTSYGLRVTTKFSAEAIVSQSGENMQGASVTASMEDIYPEMAAVMDRFNAAAESLDRYTDQVQDSIERMTNHIANFRDNRVNVPYIREIKEADDQAPAKYWFVNGRSTGVKVEPSVLVEFHGQDDGLHELEDIITQVIDDSINNGDTIIGPYIEGAVNNYITNNNPAAVLLQKPYIEYIKAGTYTGNANITEIPETQDYQNLSASNTDNDPKGMFSGCEKLENAPRLELHNAEDISNMFYNCKKIVTIYIPDTVSCKDFDNAFSGCEKLENLTFDATNAESMSGTFSNCTSLKNLRIDNIDPMKINDIDLSDTNIDFASLEYIVMHMKSQIYNTSYDTNGPSATVNITVKSNLSVDNRSVMDLVYNAQMNKNIKINILN